MPVDHKKTENKNTAFYFVRSALLHGSPKGQEVLQIAR